MEIKIGASIVGLGYKIKQARKAKSFSQADLGDLMNWSAARVSEIETEAEGRSNISIEQLINLEKNLNKKLLSPLELIKAIIQRYEECQEKNNDS